MEGSFCQLILAIIQPAGPSIVRLIIKAIESAEDMFSCLLACRVEYSRVHVYCCRYFVEARSVGRIIDPDHFEESFRHVFLSLRRSFPLRVVSSFRAEPDILSQTQNEPRTTTHTRPTFTQLNSARVTLLDSLRLELVSVGTQSWCIDGIECMNNLLQDNETRMNVARPGRKQRHSSRVRNTTEVDKKRQEEEEKEENEMEER